MAINKKLIHFKNKQNFKNEVANNNILDTSIVFIQDSKEISTHGTLYKTVNWSVLEEDPFNGHEYVDLGLPSGTLWAKYVIGGNNPLYFAWGEIVGYTVEQVKNAEKTFLTSNYKFGQYPSYTKYNTVDVKTTLDIEDDAAHTHMGGSWHMPTKLQIEEFINNTEMYKTTQNGIVGRLYTSKLNGNSVFIPHYGEINGSNVFNMGTLIRSNSIYEADFTKVWGLPNHSLSGLSREAGMTVLGVIG